MHRSRLKAALCWLTVFSIAMGYLESSVVVYLRELYYPGGFMFPLASLSDNIAFTEVFREIATMFMLISVAFLTGKNYRQKIAWFIYCFAVWDIFYYIFLKLLINWPDSLLTWDILFMIPLVWTGPVLAPVIASVTMILMAGIVLHFENKGNRFIISWPVYILIITGSILIFLSFINDFSTYMLKHYSSIAFFHADILHTEMQHYIPANFSWWLFISGELIIITGLYFLFSGYRRLPLA
jgi:hypothetical protein